MAPPAPLHAWQVRIKTSRDAELPVGAGVLLPGHRILTCAHVVAIALGGLVGPPSRDLAVFVDHSHAGWGGPATLIPDQWWHTAGERPSDIAILQLEEPPPPGIAPATLGTCGASTGGELPRVVLRGFPAHSPYGLALRAYVGDYGGASVDTVQLTLAPGEAVPFSEGFSGSAVMRESDGTVIGVCTSLLAREGGSGSVGFMIPIEEIPDSALDPGAPPRPRESYFLRIHHEVRTHLAELEFDSFAARCFARAVGHLEPTELRDFASCRHAFDLLHDRQDPVHRAAEFLELLAHAPRVDARLLRSWTDHHPRADARLRRSAEALRSSSPMWARPSPARLVFRADPTNTAPDRNHFRVSCVLIVEGVFQGRVTEPIAVHRDELHGFVLKAILLAAAPLNFLGCSGLNLEFILPIRLLDLPIPRWPAPVDGVGISVPLGAEHQIIYRCLERRIGPTATGHAAGPTLHHRRHQWEQRWAHLVSGGEAVELVPCAAPEEDDDALAARLQHPHAVAHLLGAYPDRPRGTARLVTALHAGCPVVMWYLLDDRDQRAADDERFTELGRELLPADRGPELAQAILALPTALHLARAQSPPPAPGADASAGARRKLSPYGVTVLWDNPEMRDDGSGELPLKSPGR